jgi:hypothetical protein
VRISGLISMASTCSQPIIYNYPHAFVESGFQFSKPPPSPDASIFGCATRFNLSAMDVPASTDDRRFQAPPAVDQLLLPAYAAELSEDGEIFDSDDDDDDDDDDDLPSVRQILASPRRVIEMIDLTCDDDGDVEGDSGSHTEVSWLRYTPTARHRVTLTPTLLNRPFPGRRPTSFPPPPPSLPNSSAHTADGLTTSSTTATPGKKKHPWVNVPRWSPLYRKLQQRSDKPLNNPSVNALHREVHAYEVHAHEICAHEMHAHKVQAYETHEMHAYEVYDYKVYPHETHAREMHAYEMYAREVHAYEMYAREVHTYEMHARQVHARQIHMRCMPIG